MKFQALYLKVRARYSMVAMAMRTTQVARRRSTNQMRRLRGVIHDSAPEISGNVSEISSVPIWHEFSGNLLELVLSVWKR